MAVAALPRRKQKNEEGRMSLGEHLIELRNRIFISAIAIVVACVAGWFASDWLIEALKEPIKAVAEAQGKTASFNYGTITGAFDLKLQITVTMAIVLSSPVWLFQIWAFLVPGLTKKEVRYGLGFFLTAVPLFLGGVMAGWFVFPHIVELMTSFSGSDASNILDAKIYYDFFLKLVLVVGVAFVLPVFLVLLNFVGFLSGKSIIKSWRVAILLIAVFCAIATPAADVISMFLLAIPMVILYFAAAVVSLLHDRRVAKRSLDFDGGLPA